MTVLNKQPDHFDQVLAIFKSKFVGMVVKQAMSKIITALPFMSFGPLQWLATWVIQALVTFLIEKTILGLQFLKIGLEVDNQVLLIELMLKKYKDEKDETKRKEIEDEIADAYSDIIRF